jgi:hypothetical protein
VCRVGEGAGFVSGDAERGEPVEASMEPMARCVIPEVPGEPILRVRPDGSVALCDRAGLG